MRPTNPLWLVLSASLLMLPGCTETANNQSVSFEDIKDDLSVEAFRAYGQHSPARVDTRIGTLEFTEGGFAGGYPTLETVDKLFDEMDFQRATQAYLWALPIVSYAQWLQAHEEVFQAADGQFVYQKTPRAK